MAKRQRSIGSAATKINQAVAYLTAATTNPPKTISQSTHDKLITLDGYGGTLTSLANTLLAIPIK